LAGRGARCSGGVKLPREPGPVAKIDGDDDKHRNLPGTTTTMTNIAICAGTTNAIVGR
jgi:hypothetical protein